jgi:hypothetical protein
MAEDHGQFKIYPRGFLGATLRPHVSKSSSLLENNNGFHQVISRSITKSNGVMDFNTRISGLNAEYIRGEARCLSFGFRREILQCAIAAFGTQDFENWYLQQHICPVAGEFHQKFLQDTLHFISEGKRDMCLENWQALLALSEQGGISKDIGDYAKAFFGIRNGVNNRYRQNTQLLDVLQQWCARPNGIEDLLGSLNILFGSDQ